MFISMFIHYRNSPSAEAAATFVKQRYFIKGNQIKGKLALPTSLARQLDGNANLTR